MFSMQYEIPACFGYVGKIEENLCSVYTQHASHARLQVISCKHDIFIIGMLYQAYN